MRFKPERLGDVKVQLSLTLNHTPGNETTVQLIGCAARGRLAWDVHGDRLFFAPTCVGGATRRAVTLTNLSPVNLEWRWAISRLLHGAVTAEPQARQQYPPAIEHIDAYAHMHAALTAL